MDLLSSGPFMYKSKKYGGKKQTKTSYLRSSIAIAPRSLKMAPNFLDYVLLRSMIVLLEK